MIPRFESHYLFLVVWQVSRPMIMRYRVFRTKATKPSSVDPSQTATDVDDDEGSLRLKLP